MVRHGSGEGEFLGTFPLGRESRAQGGLEATTLRGLASRKPDHTVETAPALPKDALADYRAKRDPRRTNEPFSPERKDSSRGTVAGRFVVHLHKARRTHYDLRIQVGRTLKSFAVPRGPSLDPRERRLAVNTEDHPLEYLEFEEIIPEGNYGAGPMIAWDLGRVSYIENAAETGIERGKIDFVLHGFKLRGRFALVKTRRGDNEWLLLKKQDAFAKEGTDITVDEPRSVYSGLEVDELERRAELFRKLEERAAELGAPERDLRVADEEPMLAALSGARLDDPERLYELKLDGVRVVADRRGNDVTLRYRSGRPCSVSYPEIVRAVRALPGERVVLDGEIVAFDEQGRPRFQRLAPRIHARRPMDVARAVDEVPVVYLVFDLLALGGRDLTGLPLFERKALLAELVRGRGLVRVLDHIEGRGQELFALCEANGLEGLVAKQKHSPYRFGPRRGEAWVKIKCEQEDDFVVVGWIAGRGARERLGSLSVAAYRGDALVYRGRVGSGFDQRTVAALLGQLEALEVSSSPLTGPVPEETREARWVRPELVVNVRHMGYSDDGRLWHPVFRGVRADVAPKACTAGPHDQELDAELERAEAEPGETAAPIRPGLVLTNRKKVFWPDEGYTKGDLLDYYAAVAPVLLPFLKNRPVVLVRHPDGIGGKSFYQWNVPAGTPDWIRRMVLEDPDEPGKKKHVFLIDDLESLLYVVNLGCIPIHVLAFRENTRHECDFITFDLDLGEQPFARAVDVALTLREILEAAGLPAYVKTSGQGGLHVLTPLGPGIPFEAAKLLVELVGRLATARHPEFATMERRIDKRGGRLYVDTGQTGQSRTIAGPYSVRAHPRATVSTPLSWDELSGALDPARFTLATVPARVNELPDPFAGFLDERPDVAGAIGRIERYVRSAR